MPDVRGIGQKTGEKKEVAIIINGREYEVTQDELSYEQVVNLRYDNNPPRGDNVLITVTYSKGEDGKQGSLVPNGTPVKVKKEMVFNVKATDRS